MDASPIPNYHSFRDWLGSIMDSMKKQEVEFFGICSWQIWTSRNEFIFEKTTTVPELWYKRAFDLLSEYRKANSMDDSRKERSSNVKWTPPDSGWIKINVDAAVNNKDSRVGLGGCCSRCR